MSTAASEGALDSAVETALERLRDIEGGYRSYHTAVTAVVRDHPPAVTRAEGDYRRSLCQLVGVAEASDGQQQQPGQDPRLVELPGGDSVYVEEVDLLTALLEGEQRTQQQPESAASSAAQAAEGSADQGKGKPQQPAAAPPKPAGARMTKAEAAAAAAAAAEVAAAAEAEAARAAAEAAEQEAAARRCPVSSNGTRLCAETPLVADDIRSGLRALRIGLLAEMEEFAARTEGAAAEWAEQQVRCVSWSLPLRKHTHRNKICIAEEDCPVQSSLV